MYRAQFCPARCRNRHCGTGRIDPVFQIHDLSMSCLSGPNDPVIIPRSAYKTGWEVELGAIISSDTLYVAENDVLDRVAGCCIVNDVSERTFQSERDGQWIKGKSATSFGPIGPWLASPSTVCPIRRRSTCRWRSTARRCNPRTPMT